MDQVKTLVTTELAICKDCNKLIQALRFANPDDLRKFAANIKRVVYFDATYVEGNKDGGSSGVTG